MYNLFFFGRADMWAGAMEHRTRLTLFRLGHGNAARAHGSSLAPSSPPAKKGKLRILALHGYGQSGASFRRKSGSLRKQCKNVAEFTFIDALLKVPPRADARNKDVDADGGLGWWRWNADEGVVSGWRESVAQIRETVHAHGPFDGIFAFSQGASLTALALDDIKSRIKFVCLVGGFIPRNEEQARVLRGSAPYANVDVWTSYGTSDQIIPWEKSLELHRALVGSHEQRNGGGDNRSVIVTHQGGHLVSSEKGTRTSFKDFLNEQRQRNEPGH